MKDPRLREPYDLDVAIAMLLQHYTHETETEFGVAQMPEPTSDDLDLAWWTLAIEGRPND